MELLFVAPFAHIPLERDIGLGDPLVVVIPGVPAVPVV